MRKPFWLESRKCWYVKTYGGKRVRLDPDEETAFNLWHSMQAANKTEGLDATFAGIANLWLTEHEGTINSKAFQRIRTELASFVRDHPRICVDSITKAGFVRWLQKPKPGRIRKNKNRGPDILWSLSRQRDVATSIKRVITWAFNEGKISRNPIAGLRLEGGEVRSATVTQAQHEALVADALASGPDRSFALFLVAMRCGARPQQIRDVTASNIIGQTWVFARHKTAKKTRKPLIVYLPPCLHTLTRILAAKYPSGPLFRNGQGGCWKKDSIAQRVRRMRKRLDLADDFTLYAYRHTFATEALLAGVRVAEVAQLLGHTDSRMVDAVYGHLDQHAQHLLEAARAVSVKRSRSETSS